MKSGTFLFFCLALVFGYMEVYRHFQYYLAGGENLKGQVKELKEKLDQEELKLQISQFQIKEFKQDLATHLPEVNEKLKNHEKGYVARNIASIALMPTIEYRLEKAGSLFEKGKKYFREKNFTKSNKIFSKLVSTYPESLHAIESFFFLAEGQFQLKEYEDCVLNIETMMRLFPENELTGFALLRLGKIYEVQERNEDAVEVYRTIFHNYDNKDLKSQANEFIKAIQL